MGGEGLIGVVRVLETRVEKNKQIGAQEGVGKKQLGIGHIREGLIRNGRPCNIFFVILNVFFWSPQKLLPKSKEKQDLVFSVKLQL